MVLMIVRVRESPCSFPIPREMMSSSVCKIVQELKIPKLILFTVVFLIEVARLTTEKIHPAIANDIKKYQKPFVLNMSSLLVRQ
jgi:hypothetical protein